MKAYMIELVVFGFDNQVAYKVTDRTGKELVSGDPAKDVETALAGVRKAVEEDLRTS